jgi:hypothetical protein
MECWVYAYSHHYSFVAPQNDQGLAGASPHHKAQFIYCTCRFRFKGGLGAPSLCSST